MNAFGRIAARFHALSSREKAFVVACLLFMAAFAAVKWAILPARAGYQKNRAAIPQRMAAIARYEAIRQLQDRVDEELYLQVQQLEKWESGLLAGETTSAAGVYLQGLLKPLTQGPETRVTSIRSLPPVRKGEYSEVAVQMEIQTSTVGLAQLLADITGRPVEAVEAGARVGVEAEHPARLAPESGDQGAECGERVKGSRFRHA